MGYLLKSFGLSEPQFSHLKNGDNDGTYLKKFFCESNEGKKKKNLCKACDCAWHAVAFTVPFIHQPTQLGELLLILQSPTHMFLYL